ncbi:MAG: glycosyltransferase family 4 protein, partial [Tepidisphaeraceae bacterium]
MTPVLLVSGDFALTGGMDRANFALADFLARQGREVHLVAHRVDKGLASQPSVTVHLIPRPMGRTILGAPLLARAAHPLARRISRDGGRVIVNGGNCIWNDVNWVHFVHAAWEPQSAAGPLRQIKSLFHRRRSLKRERTSICASRLIITNSNATSRDVVSRLLVPEHRIRTIYLGVDARTFRASEDSEREQLRARFGWRQGAPVIMFIGALGDRR